MSTISVRFSEDVSRELASLAIKVYRSRNNLINIAVAKLINNPELFLNWDTSAITTDSTAPPDDDPPFVGPTEVDAEEQAGLNKFNERES